mgnify:CR=1 FL=1
MGVVETTPIINSNSFFVIFLCCRVIYATIAIFLIFQIYIINVHRGEGYGLIPLKNTPGVLESDVFRMMFEGKH